MNLELRNREFQSIILQLMHNNLIRLSVVLTSLTRRRNCKTTKYFRMKGALYSIELQMLRRVHYLPT